EQGPPHAGALARTEGRSNTEPRRRTEEKDRLLLRRSQKSLLCEPPCLRGESFGQMGEGLRRRPWCEQRRAGYRHPPRTRPHQHHRPHHADAGEQGPPHAGALARTEGRSNTEPRRRTEEKDRLLLRRSQKSPLREPPCLRGESSSFYL